MSDIITLTTGNMSDVVTLTVDEVTDVVTVTVLSAEGPTGPGVPIGGTADQVLSKIDGTNYNTHWVTHTKATIGLGNVDDTSDVNKPVSTAQAAADAAVFAAAVQRSNHTGTQSADTLTDGTTNKAFLATERTKLAAITGTNTGDQDLSGLLVKASNLSDLTNTTTARTNLGLGSLATQSGTFSGTSSGTNTGDQDLSGLLVKASNLSDLTNTTTARTNLGLGSAATHASTDFDTAGSAATVQAYAVQRANHTGTQAASTISDFNSVSRAQTEAELVAGTNVTITPAGSGATRTLTLSAAPVATNLSTTATSTTVTINSDTGTDATIAAADGTNAGLLLPAEKTKIANISGTNTGDQDLTGMYNTMSTGVYSFAGITLNGGDPTHKIDIPAVLGWIVDNTGAHAASPLITPISYAGQNAVSITNIATADASYILLNSSGAIYQQTAHPTAQDRRDNILIAKIAHPNRSTILSVNNTVDYDTSPMSALRDMFAGIPFINDGITCYPNGANLNFNTTGGTLTGMGINWGANPKAPNTLSVSAHIPTSFYYRTQTGGSSGLVTAIAPGSYDLAGTVTAVPGGGNQSTNQRVYLYPTGVVNVQYGQTVYTSIANALAGQQTENFIKAPNAVGSAILIGILAVRKGATDLSNTTHAVFVPASIFGESVGGVNGISTTTLQQAYNNSITPEITTDAALGALSVKRGSAADTDNVIEVLNGAGATTLAINGNGVIAGYSTIGLAAGLAIALG